ncbi:hypothetical protein [Bradyrhizobium roseum]|uniref:hypothetical protein n=1 Tax=Bradyrhizobium roseum TaxID=3056648 RepID=UPI002628071D|nr:hypothetical protein [Bradyrhizobium roseus]WKA26217.1 hypothetical protein QUH67_21680 [Bradyrhizobium roseus]
MQRPDREIEVLRRHNAAGRARAHTIYMAGLPDDAFNALNRSLSARHREPCRRVSSMNDIAPLISESGPSSVLPWGRDRIGIGLLKALRARQTITFEERPSQYDWVASESGHIVVCEEGEGLAQVIAANYAFSLNAGLFLIPEVDKDRAEDLLEAFYKLQDGGTDISPDEGQARLRQELLNLCGSIPIPENGSVTFIGKLPYGFAYPEHPTTHLFEYPDLGCAVVNGFSAGQQRRPATGVVVLVDPSTTPAPEIQSAIELLEPRQAFIRVYQDRAANVRHVSEMLEHFPYDLLIIATHCGDSSGYRWTHQFKDSEGLDRTVVTDVAVGFARTDNPQILKVGHFFRFVSVDGVDWTDREAKSRLYVGNVMHDFNKLLDEGPSKSKPVKRETVGRVVGSSALMMSDSNLIFAQHTIANMGTPIVINNACLSWHRLAGDMMFAGARGYIGTLFPVLSSEAAEVATKLLNEHWGKPLAVALWSAQHDVYGSKLRHPYVVAGVFTQNLQIDPADHPNRIRRQLSSTLEGYKEMLAGAEAVSETKRATLLKDIVKIFEAEIAHFNNLQD